MTATRILINCYTVWQFSSRDHNGIHSDTHVAYLYGVHVHNYGVYINTYYNECTYIPEAAQPTYTVAAFIFSYYLVAN